MSCSTCGNTMKSTCSSCGGSSSECVVQVRTDWQIPVEDLLPPETASRKYAYLLPDNNLYILNYNGDGYLKIATSPVEE